MTKVIFCWEDGSEKALNIQDIRFMAVYGGRLVVERMNGRQETMGRNVDVYFDTTEDRKNGKD